MGENSVFQSAARKDEEWVGQLVDMMVDMWEFYLDERKDENSVAWMAANMVVKKVALMVEKLVAMSTPLMVAQLVLKVVEKLDK